MVDLLGLNKRFNDKQLINAMQRSDALISEANPMGYLDPITAAQALVVATPEQRKKFSGIDKMIFMQHIAQQPWYDPDIPTEKILSKISSSSSSSSTPSSKPSSKIPSDPRITRLPTFNPKYM